VSAVFQNKFNRELHSFPGGLELKTCKELTNDKESLITPLPDKIILPLQQHIGNPSLPLLKIGDKVLKGQKVAQANGYISVPVHASTSGKIIDISTCPSVQDHSIQTPCISIEPDGNDTWFEIQPVEDYLSVDPQQLQQLILEAGIVGMGGAGFPAHVKLSEGTAKAIDTLIINGVECEPYISCDDRIIREKADYIVSGTRMLQHAIQAKHCVIAVEEDMPGAFDSLNKFINENDDIELVKVPTRYPAGGEKQLIKVLTGKDVPSGGLPIHIGIVMHNVGTAAAAFRAVTRGEPLLSRYVTVSGSVKEPRNLQVLLGTPVIHCLEQVGYQQLNNEAVIMGGPMMGKHIHDTSMPVIKTTNSIIVTSKFIHNKEIPCIGCGQCIDVCPAKLLPQELFAYARAKNIQQTRELHLFDCIECGCCAYVCPSKIPLVQYYRQAKIDIAIHEKKQAEYNHARSRFEAHNERLACEDDRFDKEKVNSSEKDSDGLTDKQSYIQAAVERMKQKRNKNK
jgi:H+/Na+-translocating ferredoxin:NAD+ oxidoreductase subunit C